MSSLGNLLPNEVPQDRTTFAQRIWNALRELNLPISIAQYNSLLKVYVENGHEFEPATILADIEKNGLQPNRYDTFNMVCDLK